MRIISYLIIYNPPSNINHPKLTHRRSMSWRRMESRPPPHDASLCAKGARTKVLLQPQFVRLQRTIERQTPSSVSSITNQCALDSKHLSGKHQDTCCYCGNNHQNSVPFFRNKFDNPYTNKCTDNNSRKNSQVKCKSAKGDCIP